ncbi:MAG: HAD-IA family hydrolase [Rugosibacter sp.]|nr:HAD-IA family hydrolase [Rugosibacter sp.]
MTKTQQQPAAIFFDLDGTLADTAPDLAGALNRLRAERNLPPLPLSTLRPFVSAGARGLLAAGLSLQPTDSGYLAAQTRFLALYEQHIDDKTQLFEGIAECLDHLDNMGLPWGIVTNKALRFARPLIAGLNLTHRTACLIGSDSTPTPKPHPAPLLLAAKITQVSALQCLYIGDDERDIIAAHAANMTAVAAAWGYLGSDKPVSDWGADITLDSPKDISRMVTPNR